MYLHSQSRSHVRLTVNQSVSQYVLMSSPLWFSWPDVCYCLTITVVSLWDALSDQRSGLSIYLHSQSRVTLLLTVSQYILVPSPLWACQQTLFSVWRFLSEHFFLVSVGRPLWREFVSVICVSVCSNLYENEIRTFHVFTQLSDI
jgi:hypothetical protein